jgi:hypothetical protein
MRIPRKDNVYHERGKTKNNCHASNQTCTGGKEIKGDAKIKKKKK